MSEKKAALLGMPIGTATGRLRKSLMYSLADKLGLLTCHRCAEQICTEESLSIEHKVAWESADDPVKMFFDLDNIAFSHLSCNIREASKPTKKWIDAKEKSRKGFNKYYSNPVNREGFLRRKRERYHSNTTAYLTRYGRVTRHPLWERNHGSVNLST